MTIYIVKVSKSFLKIFNSTKRKRDNTFITFLVPNLTLTLCVQTVRFLKYVWQFFNIIHERLNFHFDVTLTLYAAIRQNGQTHANNSSAVYYFEVYLAIKIFLPLRPRISFQERRYVIIVSATFGRRDIQIVIVSCNPKQCRKSYTWYVITLVRRALEYAEFNGDVRFFFFGRKYPFWANLVQK